MSVYTPRQVRCMEAIGLVPWVRRTAQLSPVAASTAAEPSSDHATQSAPVLIGNLNAQLLLAFTHFPLEASDSALLDGMLRAIGLSNADVCFAAVESASDLNALTPTAVLSQVLYFGSTDVTEDAVQPVAMALSNEQLNGWQLPSLAVLREQPQRKRQAWTTLKSLRSSLDRY